MAEEKEQFLSRWSRLKREAKEVPEKKAPEEKGEAPVLPPVESLTPESDYTGFMHPKVEDALRRVALKKLFSDPHFNVPDPFEAYSGDWTGGEPIPPEMLATLNQARTLLFDKEEKKDEEPHRDTAAVTEAHVEPEANAYSNPDEPGRKDA